MSINELKKDFFTGVGIMRNSFPVARYFFDIHIDEDGIAGYYVWRRNAFRFPIIHPLLDFVRRKSRTRRPREEVVESDDRNFFIPFGKIQGCVIHSKHKEIQMLSAMEKVTFIFRPIDDYNRFVEHLRENISDRVFSRDKVKILDSVYIS